MAVVTEEVGTDPCNVVGMPLCNLPVKFLELPRIASRLSIKDCQPILDMLQCKIQGWAIQKLSYGGRLQLVESILYGVQTHWSSTFIPPKAILKNVGSLISSFVWTRGFKHHYLAKVGWKDGPILTK